jgi:transcriptional regulator GlxA family with amidase domain
VVIVDQVNLLDLSGPVQVLDAANHRGASYALEYVSESIGVDSAQGLHLGRLSALPPVGPGELVLIPGPSLKSAQTGDALFSETVLDWIRTAAEAGAQFATICTGAALLGDAGLLDGRHCTSHWSVTGHMQLRYPLARVRDGVLFVHDGPISTSAGIASGIDLTLSLVERDYGPALAAAVARDLVIYIRRDGLAEQLSPFLDHRSHVNPAVHECQDLISRDISRRNTLPELAAAVHLSPRGLSKAFIAATGMTPLQYQQDLRLDLAANLLRETIAGVEEISTRCGFADPRHFRRLFAERRGLSPSRYRQLAVN